MDCTRFGNKLTYYREKNEMTEKELARKLHVSTRKLIKLENSEAEPNDKVVARASELFGVDFWNYLDLDEKHGGKHNFDLDDPEYSPLTTLKGKKTVPNKTVVQKKKTRNSYDDAALRRRLSKIIVAIALLCFFFLQDIVEGLFNDSSLGFIMMPVPFIILLIGLIIGKKR